MSVKTREEIELMRASAAILSIVHGEIARAVDIGVSTEELDHIAETCIKQAGARPSFKGYRGFPASTCMSVNHQVVHAPPSKYRLKEGDIISIDCGVYYQGFHSDCAFTYGIGKISKKLLHLLAVAEESLSRGIAQAKVGNHLDDIGYAIQQYVESNNYSIVDKYTGHGIGRQLHEEPSVHNVGNPGEGPAIEEGMVLAIEPIIKIGSSQVYSPSKWIVEAEDGMPSAHFEHTVAIVDGNAEPLTTYRYIKAQYG